MDTKIGLERLSDVKLNEPSDDILQKLIACRHLQFLRIGGGDYKLEHLRDLTKQPLLSHLRISGRKLTPEFIADLSKLPQLITLNLMRTNITADSLNAFSSLDRLRQLILIQTDVKLSDLPVDGILKQLDVLHLPLPASNQTDSLSLSDLPNLQTLSLYEYDEYKSEVPVTVELARLPQLQQVFLDGMRRFDLTLDGTPVLKVVNIRAYQAFDRTVSKSPAAGGLWLRSLTVKNCEQKLAMGINASGLESARFEKAGLLYVSLSPATFLSHSDDPNINMVGVPNIKDMNLTGLQSAIDAFADANGPHTLRLDNFPTEQLDLARLAANNGIKTLIFHESSVAFDQMLQVISIPSLAELHSLYSKVSGSECQQLIERAPKLQRLGLMLEGMRTLRIENATELRNGPRYRTQITPVDAIRLINVPKLADSYVLQPGVAYARIENAPSLTGIAFRSAVPARSAVKGVRDLKFFIAGGSRVTDDYLSDVLKCKSLEELALIHPQITEASLEAIAKLPNLKKLRLEGCEISDEHFSDLTRLNPYLTDLWLIDTKLTPAIADDLRNLTMLKSLKIHVSSVDDDLINAITSKQSLSKLAIIGSPIDDGQIQALAKMSFVRDLELSGCELNEFQLTAIADTPWLLERFTMRGGKADAQGMMKLIAAKQRCRFDIELADVGVEPFMAIMNLGKAVPGDWEENMIDEYSVSRIPPYNVRGIPTDHDSHDSFELDARRFDEKSSQFAQAGPSSQPAGPLSVIQYWFGLQDSAANSTDEADDLSEEELKQLFESETSEF